MTKKLKLSIIILIVTLLISNLFSGCSKNTKRLEDEKPLPTENTQQQTGEQTQNKSTPSWAQDTSQYKFDWYINVSWWKWPGDYGNDYLSELLKKKTGAIINIITPTGDGAQQINTMIASNSLPDVVTVESWLDYRTKMSRAGYLWALNDLIEKYDPSFKEIIFEDIFNWYAESDGKTYGLPNYAYSRYALKEGEKLVPNCAFIMRKDIYEKLGSPDIKSPDDLLAVFRKVKEDVKTYNGSSIVPFQMLEFNDMGNGTIDWLAQYFSVPFEDEEGKWVDRRFHPKYFQVIKFLNSAYREGFISKDNFTETRDMINEKVSSGRVFSLLGAPQDFVNQMKVLFNNDNNAVYKAFAFTNYDGDRPYLSDISGFGWLTSSITKSAKNPDRLIKLFHYLYSDEGQMDMHFGGEELYTINEKGHIVYKDEIKEKMETEEGKKYYAFGFNMLADWLRIRNFYEPPTKPEDIASNDLLIKDPLKEFTYDGKLGSLKSDPSDPRTDKMLDLNTRINMFWGKQVTKMIIAKSEAEAKEIYESTLNNMKSMGFEELWAYNNDSFQRAKKALGVDIAWPGYRK